MFIRVAIRIAGDRPISLTFNENNESTSLVLFCVSSPELTFDNIPEYKTPASAIIHNNLNDFLVFCSDRGSVLSIKKQLYAKNNNTIPKIKMVLPPAENKLKGTNRVIAKRQ